MQQVLAWGPLSRLHRIKTLFGAYRGGDRSCLDMHSIFGANCQQSFCIKRARIMQNNKWGREHHKSSLSGLSSLQGIGQAHSALMTIGLAETGAPMVRKCLSVISLMASDTAVSGMMRGPYSSESSSCRRHLGCSAVGSCTIWTIRGLLVPISTSLTLKRNCEQRQIYRTRPMLGWMRICRAVLSTAAAVAAVDHETLCHPFRCSTAWEALQNVPYCCISSLECNMCLTSAQRLHLTRTSRLHHWQPRNLGISHHAFGDIPQ